MAAATAVFVATAPSSFALERWSFCGSAVESKAAAGLPSLRRPLKIEASKGKKVSVKEPLGPSGDTKYRGGVDASGSPAKGKGVYQFAKKYGANVDGYSPIYAPEEWSANGDTYAGGTTGLALWALTLGGVLLVGALLVINTSAIGQ